MSGGNIEAVHNYNSVFVDANVVINLIRSDPTGGSLNELMTSGSTLYITDTVNEELRANLTGVNYNTYTLWAYNNYGEGAVLPRDSDVPVGRNAGEISILNAINEGFEGGPYLVLSGDSGADFGTAGVLNTVELANSLLLSGEINYARYAVLLVEIGVVAPHEFFDENGIEIVLVPGTDGYDINGNIVEVRANGLIVNGEHVGYLQTFEIDPSTGAVIISGPQNCFLSGTQITMADGTTKPIEDVHPDDQVQSYDDAGELVSSRVTRTFVNHAKHVLDVHGLMVTPGHVTLCGDGVFEGRHVPMIDILRSDGALVRERGSKVRAGTNCDLGSIEDRMVQAITGDKTADGRFTIRDSGQIRFGTRFIMDDGRDISVAELVTAAGGTLTKDGLVATKDASDGTPFHWPFSAHLPKPEDYVLQRSALHLNDVYQAGEWEAVAPQMPAPQYGEAGPAISDHPAIKDSLPPNVPLSMRGGQNGPAMNRKQRRAYDAKMRKA